MLFLSDHHCMIRFYRPNIRASDKTDRQGRMLITKVQVPQEVTIPPLAEAVLAGTLKNLKFCSQVIIDKIEEEPPDASRINRQTEKRQALIGVSNPTTQPLILKAGERIGTISSVDSSQIGENLDTDGHSTKTPTSPQ